MTIGDRQSNSGIASRNGKGWWGENPSYHIDVFVLTHHARKPIEMEGGTTFHFVMEEIHAALAKAWTSCQGL